MILLAEFLAMMGMMGLIPLALELALWAFLKVTGRSEEGEY